MSSDRTFLPAADHDLFLPLHDPLVTYRGEVVSLCLSPWVS